MRVREIEIRSSIVFVLITPRRFWRYLGARVQVLESGFWSLVADGFLDIDVEFPEPWCEI